MSTGVSQQFCVRWNSHLGSLGAAFPQLLAGQRFVDVTLACEGHQVHCHRLVLAACSSYFESLLGENPCKHPIIILPRDIKLWEIQALVDFMYKGEVNVSQAGLPDLLKCAEILQIRGLCGSDAALNLNQIPTSNSTPQQQTSTTTAASSQSTQQQQQNNSIISNNNNQINNNSTIETSQVNNNNTSSHTLLSSHHHQQPQQLKQNHITSTPLTSSSSSSTTSSSSSSNNNLRKDIKQSKSTQSSASSSHQSLVLPTIVSASSLPVNSLDDLDGDDSVNGSTSDLLGTRLCLGCR